MKNVPICAVVADVASFGQVDHSSVILHSGSDISNRAGFLHENRKHGSLRLPVL